MPKLMPHARSSRLLFMLALVCCSGCQLPGNASANSVWQCLQTPAKLMSHSVVQTRAFIHNDQPSAGLHGFVVHRPIRSGCCDKVLLSIQLKGMAHCTSRPLERWAWGFSIPSFAHYNTAHQAKRPCKYSARQCGLTALFDVQV